MDVAGNVNLYIEHLCEVMHDAYEKAAANNSWETQEASRKPWADVPEANKATMREAVDALLDEITPKGSIDDLRQGQCGYVLMIYGDHFRCDLGIHHGWAHSNKDANAIWSTKDEMNN